jgi:hypothetical protein
LTSKINWITLSAFNLLFYMTEGDGEYLDDCMADDDSDYEESSEGYEDGSISGFESLKLLPCSLDNDEGVYPGSFLAPLPPECLAIVPSVRDSFVKWRRKQVSHSYKQRFGYTHLVSHPGDRREFMKRCRDGCDGDEGGYRGHRSPFPSPHYFDRKIIPVVSLMARTPDEFEVILGDALECLKRLMVLSGRCTVFGNLLRSFFEPHDGRYRDYHSVHGQFDYFYSKYGRFAALSVAAFQGFQVDRHYDGWDYSYSTDQIERMFEPVLEKLPREYWNDAFEVFYLYGGETDSEAFWNKFLPEVIDNVLKAGKPHLFGYFFRLMKARPSISEHFVNTGYSFNNGVAMLAELEALDGMPLREESLGLVCTAIRKSAGVSRYGEGGRVHFTFRDNAGPANTFFGSSVNISEMLKGFRENGYSDDKIREIFTLVDKLPGECGFLVVSHYLRLNSIFPGGVDGLIKYLRSFRKAPVAAAQMVSLFSEDYCDGAVKALDGNVDKFLSIGARLVRKFGDLVSSYFNSSEVTLLFAEILKRDPSEFNRKIEQVEEFVEKFVKKNPYFGDIFRHCLAFCGRCGKENFADFLAGFGLVLSDGEIAINRLLKSGQEARMMGEDYSRYRAGEAMVKLYADSCYRFLLNEKVDGKEAVFPSGFNFDDHAKIAVALGSRRSVLRYDDNSRYFDLLSAGLDYRLAATVACGEVKGLSLPTDVTREEMNDVAGIVCGVHESVAEVCNAEGCPAIADGFGDGGSDRHCVALDKVTMNSLVGQERALDKLAADPKLSGLVDFEKLRRSIKQAKSLLFFKDAVACGVVSGKGDFSKDSFLSRAESSTRAAIAGMSLMIATGVVHVPALDGRIRSLPINLDPAKLIGGAADPSVVSGVFGRYENLLAENMAVALEFVKDAVLKARSETPGLMFIGGKIHTVKAMDHNVLELLQKLFGFGNTPFHLIHAGESLVLPPMATSLEFKFLVLMMQKFGVIDSEFPDFQNAMGGRWSPETSAIVGASMLLGTTRRVPYAPGAFSTTHDSQTGKRIMAYDAGVKIDGLPFDLPNAGGRTDILGRHDITDADRFQPLGCSATHHDYNGRFAGLFKGYADEFVRILARNGLLEHLRESAWVFDHAKEGDTPEGHERMVKSFTEVWDSASSQVGFGVIGDVNRLLVDLLGSVRGQREKIIAACPDDYRRFMQY